MNHADGGGGASRQVALLVLAVVLGMSPWFSATVVAPAMLLAMGQDELSVVWLTLSVQLGFVLGSLASAAFLLSDRFSPRRLAAGSALLAAIATLALVLPGLTFASALVLRLVAGAAMAGVYPPGIKIAAGWTTHHRGIVIGLLVGGTTLGSALPHLLRLASDPGDWHAVIVLAAACAVAGSLLLALTVKEGPYQAPSAPFDPRALRQVFLNRGVRLATGGYLGHMWELYAMWSSIGVFWAFVASRYGWSTEAAAVAAFVTVASGAVGSVYAGWVADRVGRSRVTIVAMGLSGLCALAIGPAAEVSLVLVGILAVVWGASVVADSAQFSAAVTEYSDISYVGTAVTVQTALGFLLTMVTIQLVPLLNAAWGWQWAYAPLALGPVAGIACMWRLRGMERPVTQ